MFVEFDGPTNVGTTSGDAWVILQTADVCSTDVAGFTDTGGTATTPGTPGTGSTDAATCGIDFSNQATDSAALADSTQGIELGFNIRIGDKQYHTLFIDRFGYVTFGTAPANGAFTFLGAQTVSALRQQLGSMPFIAPFYANLVVPDGTENNGDAIGTFGSYTPFEGGAAYYRGVADPIAPYSIGQALPAFSVIWFDGTNNIATQMMLYQKNTAGDFYLNLRYGQNDPDSYDISATGPLPAIAGFALTAAAADSAQLSGPLPNATGYFYEFDSGHLLGSTTPPPPPPPKRCDVDGDKDVDLNDLVRIAEALGHKASSATDPRDADGNRVINLKDLVKCIEQCTRKYCGVK
ncbi:MAG: hypothetical protein ABJD53_12110 [Gammaproteobacteria bacterium]